MPNPETRYQHAGNAKITTLVSSISNSDTSLQVADGTNWPDGSIGPFFIVGDKGMGTEEKLLISNRTGTVPATLSVAGGVAGRGQDGTSASAHSASTGNWFPVWTAAEADKVNAHAASTNVVHGVAGNVVGTTDTQTMTDKTINTSVWNSGNINTPAVSGGTFSGSPTFTGAPSITDLSNAQHAHAAAASGALLPTAAPSVSAVGDSSVTGTAVTYSRTDHKHAREGFGNVVAQTSFGAGSTNGSATTLSRSDHAHGTPANPLKIAAVSAQVTSAQTVGPSDSVIVTAPAITGDGSTKVKISIAWRGINPNAGVTLGKCKIKESSTTLAEERWITDSTLVTGGGSLFVIVTPSAASHTYTFEAIRESGPTGSTLDATSTSPATIAVEQFV